MISKVRHRQTKVEYALKTIQLEKMTSKLAKEMRNEIEILKRLDHPNIIRAIETFESDRMVYLVMKLCTGGDLRSRAPYTEKDAADIIIKASGCCLLSADFVLVGAGRGGGEGAFLLAHLRDSGAALDANGDFHRIVHRDLKLENVVYESKLQDADIFIIDYGLSKIVDTSETPMKEMVGTLYTMAPEVLTGKTYDRSCDMWSIGVMAFLLLSDNMPFDFSSKKRLIKSVELGRDFIRHMMVKEPSRRYTAGQALKVKRTGLMLVAYRSHPDETKAMRNAFNWYDVDRNGRVGRAEFQEVLKQQGYTNEELVGLFDEVDDDHDGYLHYTEFLAATLEMEGKKVANERLAEAFDQLDMDDSGHISKANLVEFLGRDSKGYDVTQLIAEADEDGTGGINLQEFCTHMRKRWVE
eukprot:jgi/Undpi1/1083/HiC_scaffold_10.g04546.m1